MELVYQLFYCFVCAIPVGVISLTVSRTHVFLSFREWVASKSKFFGELVSCPLCLSFWVAALGQMLFHAPLDIVNHLEMVTRYITGWLTIVGLAPISAGLMYRTYAIMRSDDPAPSETEDGSDSDNEKLKIMSEVQNWLLYGARGASSEAMLGAIIGDSKGVNHPYDSGDFSRCVGLLKACPSLQPYLYEVSELSPTWAALISNWDELVALHEEEKNTAAPKLNKRIDEILKSVK